MANYTINSAGKIKEKGSKDLLVPRLPLETLLKSNNKLAQMDEPVINIVTGGSFGRQNNVQ